MGGSVATAFFVSNAVLACCRLALVVRCGESATMGHG